VGFSIAPIRAFAVSKAEDETGGRAMYFRTFVQCNDGPRVLEAKGLLGQGDYGEAILTLCLPYESFAFSGELVRLRADYLLHLSAFLAKPDAELHCFRIEPHPSGGALIVATDGYCFGVFHDKQALVRRPVLVKPTKRLLGEFKTKYGERPRHLVLDGGHACVEDLYGRQYYIEPEEVVKEDGHFPDWRSFLGKIGDGEAAAAHVLLNAENLARYRFGGNPAIRMFASGPEAPVVVRHQDFPEFFGLIMPLTAWDTDVTADPRPEWLFGSRFETTDHFFEDLEASMVAQ
jgi:hypothetical protein